MLYTICTKESKSKNVMNKFELDKNFYYNHILRWDYYERKMDEFVKCNPNYSLNYPPLGKLEWQETDYFQSFTDWILLQSGGRKVTKPRHFLNVLQINN